MSPRFADLLFDFDYTLADSSAGIIDCVNHALSQLDLPPASPEQIRRAIGLSLPATLRQLVGEGHAGQASAFSRLFIERADQIMVNRTVLFPGITPILAELSRAGARLGIVSTKYRHRVSAQLFREISLLKIPQESTLSATSGDLHGRARTILQESRRRHRHGRRY